MNLFNLGINDRIESISNNTGLGANVILYNWTGSYWDMVWESSPGNWGDIPGLYNTIDGIRVECG